jgi:hypothetical protein
MSTLIKNIGILDARKASPEQIAGIGRLNNIGCLVIGSQNKAAFMKTGMQNVGRMLELDDAYRVHTGPLHINAPMLADAVEPIKFCVVGPLTIDADITPELLQQKLGGICLIGPASVPEKLYGAFMSIAKDITGIVSVASGSGKMDMGKVEIDDAYLEALEDNTDLNITGKLSFNDDTDPALFARKVASLKVMGIIKCPHTLEEHLRKVLVETDKARVRIHRLDYHYVPGGTIVDTFTMLTVDKQTLSCHGILILDEEVTPDVIEQRDLRFEAGTLYFPKTIMQEMASRLAPGTKGLPYEPGKLELTTCEQSMTSARLQEMPDKCSLVVLGELDVDDSVDISLLSSKIGTLDNYGEITAMRDIASILQGKLRRNEGSMNIREDEQADVDTSGYDNIIENLATYTL